jgi:hypothetical protein
MKQLFWFVCIATLSIKGHAKNLNSSVPIENSVDDQLTILSIPEFPTNSHHQIPIYNEATGELVTFVPPSIAKIAYIFVNVPREHRDFVLRAHGIALSMIHE